MMQIVVLLLALLNRNSLTVRAQSSPSLYTSMFDYSVSYRQSVCERQDMFHNRTVTLRNALSGLDINTLVANDGTFVLADEQGAIPLGSAGGLVPVLLDEMARRGGFEWRNSFGWLESIALPANRTYGELLSWSLDTFDVSAARWAKTLDRIELGASFPEAWYEGTLILVGIEAGGSGSLDVWAFLEPFSAGVWILICVTLVVSGLIYMCLDWYDEESDSQILEKKPTQNIWLAALSFTGQFEYEPSTDAARIFTFSLAFFCLLVTSAYTANLASFLVVQNTPAVQITGVSDAFKNGYVFCVFRGTADEEALLKAFPEARVIPVGENIDIYHAVQDGRCDVALTSMSSWNEVSQNKDVNGDCQLKWIGRSFMPRESGFATRSDSGTLCTSLIRDVLNLHMVEMKTDGFLERAWNAHLNKFATVDCDTVSEPEDEDTTQLTLQAMGGTFIVHYCLTAVAILVAVFCKWRRRRREKEASARRPSNAILTTDSHPESRPLESLENRSGATESEDHDVVSRYDEMLQKHEEKMSEMLAMMHAMQSEANAMRELMSKDVSSLRRFSYKSTLNKSPTNRLRKAP